MMYSFAIPVRSASYAQSASHPRTYEMLVESRRASCGAAISYIHLKQMGFITYIFLASPSIKYIYTL
jgi:hypothetical protein